MNCPYCHGPLMEIDYYGEALVAAFPALFQRVPLRAKPRLGRPGLH